MTLTVQHDTIPRAEAVATIEAAQARVSPDSPVYDLEFDKRVTHALEVLAAVDPNAWYSPAVGPLMLACVAVALHTEGTSADQPPQG